MFHFWNLVPEGVGTSQRQIVPRIFCPGGLFLHNPSQRKELEGCEKNECWDNLANEGRNSGNLETSFNYSYFQGLVHTAYLALIQSGVKRIGSWKMGMFSPP